jgi:hypothetical protein
MMLGATTLACGRAPAPASLPPPAAIDLAPLALAPLPEPAPTAAAEVAAPCATDADCGYDPAVDRCASDPRANRQPPLCDQGIVCYCDEAARRCATLRVPPVPCESDASCAVRLDPRPHPIAADAAHPHEHGRACRDFTLSTTCERTNISTMHRHTCPDRRP